MGVARATLAAYERTAPGDLFPARAATGGAYDATLVRGAPEGFAAWVTNDAGDLYLLRVHPEAALRALQETAGVRVDGVWGGRTAAALLARAGFDPRTATDAQVREAVERALAARLLANASDPAYARGLEVVLPARTELPPADVVAGGRTLRVPAVVREPRAVRLAIWSGAMGPFAPAAAPRAPASVATPAIADAPLSPALPSVPLSEALPPAPPATPSETRPPAEARLAPAAQVNTDAVVRLGLGLGIVFGVMWLFDRTQPPERRLMRVL